MNEDPAKANCTPTDSATAPSRIMPIGWVERMMYRTEITLALRSSAVAT